jgi:hypothetical protein
MRSMILTGIICGLFCLGTIATTNGAIYAGDGCSCGCDGPCGSKCACRASQNCQCSDRDCAGDCGYPYRWPGARSCNPCGDACRPQTCHDKTYCGPLTPIFALLTRDCWMGSGCGERYWGDFYGDPPDWCDPCDRCGNYTGRADGWSGSGVVTGGSKPCNCGGAQTAVYNSVPMEGKVIRQSDRVTRQIPTPAKSKSKTIRQ